MEDLLLVKEYFRRAIIFIDTLELDIKTPYFSAANAIGKDIQIDFENGYPQIESIDNAFFRAICEYYVKWAALIDNGEPVAEQFQDLYEPLIKLFERGGKLGKHHGDFIVGIYAFPVSYWRSMALNTPLDISNVN